MKSTTMAETLFLEKADNGDADAQFHLGVCYFTGDLTTQDYTKAAKWFSKAADQGYADAQYNLGICYKNGFGVEPDEQRAFELYLKSAEQGNMRAQYNLGYWLLMNGDSMGYYWMKKAADQGLDDAQYNVGVCYYDGVGVNKDILEAFQWFIKAKEQGHEGALSILHEILG